VIYVSWWFAFAAMLATPPHTPEAAASRVLRDTRASAAARVAVGVAALSIEGMKRSFGLAGSYDEVIDLRTGRYRWNARYPLFADGAGRDRRGCWSEDSSEVAHRLDSTEATAVGITLTYLLRREYLHAQYPVAFHVATSNDHARQANDPLQVRPPHGAVATLWVRGRTGLVDHVSIHQGTRIEMIRYSDYRRFAGLVLPFRIDVDNGDDSETGIISVSAYRVLPHVPRNALNMPPPRPDVAFTRGALETSVRLTQTRFAAVHSLRIGGATIAHQPFTVLYIDLGHTRDTQGAIVPIAGILGLEVFERFTVSLDFRTQTVTLRRPHAEMPSRDAFRSRFTSDTHRECRRRPYLG